MTVTDRTTDPKESPMTATTTAPTENPHRIPALITGWAVIAVVLGGLWGAGHDPEHAAWSGFAIVAIMAIYFYQKVRKALFDRHSHR